MDRKTIEEFLRYLLQDLTPIKVVFLASLVLAILSLTVLLIPVFLFFALIAAMAYSLMVRNRR